MFRAVYELRLASYGLKLSQTRFAFSFVRFLTFHAIIGVGMARTVRPHLDNSTRALHAGKVIGSDEFAKN